MPLTVIPTPYGRPAAAALRDRLALVKASDPLAPATVVVPTNSVGVSARRMLASGELGAVTPGRAGLVGVTFVTVLRLAELLAAPKLAGEQRRPVSTPVVAAAVRRVLASAPGLFAPVATHPATEEALVGAHRELSDLDDAALDVLASQSPRARDVVRIHRAVRRALATGWYDEQDLMRAACELVAHGAPLVDELGAIVCHLPQRWSMPAARLVAALAEHREIGVVVGLTGVARADAAVVASVERAGGKVDDDARSSVEPAHATSVVACSDPDDEVRAVVRGLVDAMRAGARAERLAVLYGSSEPYARLLHEHLELAGIHHNGTSVRTLADSVFGRALVRLLALPDDGFRRDDLFALLATAPILDGRGRAVRGVEWERASRRAGVIGGLDQWRSRLSLRAADVAARGDTREQERVVALLEFLETLAAAVDPPTRGGATSWSAFAKWAQTLARRFLGDERRRAQWPPFEQEAARRVEAALDRLGGLDSVEPSPTLDVFRRTLLLELDAARDRVGRIGEGVLVGPVGLALGVELDGLWVCGLAEGVFPSVRGDDPLLADRERAALDGELPLRRARADDEQRALLAALSSTTGARVYCFPRGDLRRSTERVPSRFLLDTVEALTGARPANGELPSSAQWCESIASFVSGVAHAPFPATEQELGVQAALDGARWIRVAEPVARADDATRARASDDFTRFDGNLAGVGDALRAVSPTNPDAVMAVTRLERWANCPHAYFVRDVLGVLPVERPEDVVQITPLDRGSLVHEILDRFVAERVADGAVGPWDEQAVARLRELAEEACAAVEARGLAGRRLMWERERRVLFADLEAFVAADNRHRAEARARTLATELEFDGLEIPLDDRRSVRFRGRVDRVDAAGDDRLLVIDYKTGKPDSYLGLADDPIGQGTRLQLPVYAHAALAQFGATRTAVDVAYWFVGRGENRMIGYEADAATEDAFVTTLRTIVDGIDAGCFVSRPAPPGPRFYVDCEYCDPDGRGTTDRWREWERKYEAAALEPYRRLLAEDDDADEDWTAE